MNFFLPTNQFLKWTYCAPYSYHFCQAGGALLVVCEVELCQVVSKAMSAAGLFLHHPYYYASMKQRKISTFEQVSEMKSSTVM